MPLRISLHAAGAFVGSTLGLAADVIHSHHLRHQAIETLRTKLRDPCLSQPRLPA